jgi:hypothetical protein
MATRKRKLAHEVKASITNIDLVKAKSSITLDISARRLHLGTLEVGRGSFFWTGKHKKKSKRISWTRFADMMDHLAYNR